MSKLDVTDELAIGAVVQKLVDAWHRTDAAAFASAFAHDADFYNVFAQRLCGRDAIACHHDHLFTGVYRDTRITDVDLSIRSAGADVAVVTWSSVLQVGGEHRRAHALSVFVRATGGWEILSLQNMAPLSVPV